MNPIETFSRKVNGWIEMALFGLGLTMAVVVALQVFCRYILNHSLFWSEELARYILVWLTFLGSSAAYRRRVHPGIDILTSRLSAGVRRWAAAAVHLISIAFFGVMVWYGYGFAWFVRKQISPALNTPKWIIFSVIPVAGTVLMLHGFAFLTRTLKGEDA